MPIFVVGGMRNEDRTDFYSDPISWSASWFAARPLTHESRQFHTGFFSGTDGNDVLRGTAQDDKMRGLGGNDRVFGKGGADSIWGDDGNDTLFGGRGDDDIEGEYGDDVLLGGRGADLLYGLEGDDTLFGGRGSDIVDGGPGTDILHGGSGHDVFRISDITTTDTIADFAPDEDHIGLRINTFFDLYPEVDEHNFSVGTVPQSWNNYLIYDAETGVLYFDRDGNEPEYDQMAIVQLQPNVALTPADFVFYI